MMSVNDRFAIDQQQYLAALSFQLDHTLGIQQNVTILDPAPTATANPGRYRQLDASEVDPQIYPRCQDGTGR